MLHIFVLEDDFFQQSRLENAIREFDSLNDTKVL